MTTVEADFWNDVPGQVGLLLTRVGYVPPSGATVDQMWCAYYNVMRREIQARSRTVEWSKELRTNTSLTSEERTALSIIEAKSIAGQNLNPHLSTLLVDTLYSDDLFNDWGIHHLHLDTPGAKPAREPGFLGRTGNLLFAFVTTKTIHFLDVRNHHAFADEVLAEILHTSFPTVIASWRAHMPGGTRPTTEERKEARKAGLTIPYQARDGTVYMPFGGGQSTSRLNTWVRSDVDFDRDLVRDLQVGCGRHAETVRKLVRDMSGRDFEMLRLRLIVGEGPHRLGFDVEEIETRVAVGRAVYEMVKSDRGVVLASTP